MVLMIFYATTEIDRFLYVFQNINSAEFKDDVSADIGWILILFLHPSWP